MKKSIYIVDDQASVLETTVLILKVADPHWEVTGFTEPLLALEAVLAKPPDLVLSDERMPKMQGSQLLEQVRLCAPKAIRIIISGQVALDKLTFITSAHQHLAKPFDIKKLREVVRRSFAAQDRIMNPGLQSVVTSLRSIPSLPHIYHSLLAGLRDDSSAMSVIAGMVAKDAGLSSKVLQLANSPLFGQDELITNPGTAVLCLGTDLIAALVLSQALFRHYESLAGGVMDVPKVWNHCWDTAYLAQQLCVQKRLPRQLTEEAFLAGLLHEMGRFILVDNYPEQFRAAGELARQTNSPLAICLRKTFQTSPSQITAYLLELWGMPDGLIAAIAAQDNPAAESGGFSTGAALYIADGLASRRSPPDFFAVEEWNTAHLQAIGCLENIAAWEKLPPGSKLSA